MKKIVIAVAALIATVAIGTTGGLMLRHGSASETGGADKAVEAAQTETGKEAPTAPPQLDDGKHSYKSLGGFLVPVIENNRTHSMIQANIGLWIKVDKTGDGEKSEGGGDERLAEIKRAHLRSEINDALYGLDPDVSLDHTRDVERLKVMIKNAAERVLGRGKVEKVLFDQLIQQPV